MTKPGEMEDRIRELVTRKTGSLPDDAGGDLVAEMTSLVEEVRAHERDRCVRLCRERAELWGRTMAAADGSPAPARDEARSRQNEARYLADLIGMDQVSSSRTDEIEM